MATETKPTITDFISGTKPQSPFGFTPGPPPILTPGAPSGLAPHKVNLGEGGVSMERQFSFDAKKFVNKMESSFKEKSKALGASLRGSKIKMECNGFKVPKFLVQGMSDTQLELHCAPDSDHIDGIPISILTDYYMGLFKEIAKEHSSITRNDIIQYSLKPPQN